MKLNDTFHQAQLEAIKHHQGPMMVLAGPGSGKTTVITHRVKNMIEEWDIDPSHILVITFTRAAAGEMKERFELLTEKHGYPVSFGTFHSVFFTILKHAYRYDASCVVREEQRKWFIHELIEDLELEVEDENQFVSDILGEISQVKGEMVKLNHYYAKNCSEEIFKRLYDGYEKRLRSGNLIDFDDMLVMCYELFTQRNDILSAWQNKFQYILIDEFQDINKVQYEVIRMLAAGRENLFIVGDDDQSIYRFRGARPEIMLGFERDYPHVKKVLLNINYRCSQEIVNAAGRLISYNKTRFPKQITANNQGGKPVTTIVWQDAREETLGIVSQMKDYIQSGYEWKDMAVLFRTNLNPRLLIEKLMEYNIPFKMKDAIPNLYEHWISQNIITYIRMALGNMERGTVLKVINRPNRYISRDSMDMPVVALEDIKGYYRDKEWMAERIERLQYDLLMIKQMAPVAAVNYIRKAIGYDEYLKEYAQFRRMKPEELYEVADQLQESAAGYKTCDAWFLHMEEYKKKLMVQVREKEAEINSVSLMTMHSAKGLEFKLVYILDVNEGVIPHQKAVMDVDLEEERRMFYVAMTRAKERLHVCCVRERYGKKQLPSRFIREYLGKDGYGEKRSRL